MDNQSTEGKETRYVRPPLVPTPAQIEEMFACAKENGVILMEAFAYLHSPLMAAIKEEIASGAISNIRMRNAKRTEKILGMIGY